MICFANSRHTHHKFTDRLPFPYGFHMWSYNKENVPSLKKLHYISTLKKKKRHVLSDSADLAAQAVFASLKYFRMHLPF